MVCELEASEARSWPAGIREENRGGSGGLARSCVCVAGEERVWVRLLLASRGGSGSRRLVAVWGGASSVRAYWESWTGERLGLGLAS
ncbi:hypothetical protein FNV43_RR04957 [Rhamnella rubrinervis]|uniref:Uncharacterized protein n=1 Tax=Rhamnella rubrinervis TaxID=2594499 RepID=A0A8K0HLS7_9ROSA|nr:hypothetical protein FNV43_RR04957 [Rhamnella rubrinervis]